MTTRPVLPESWRCVSAVGIDANLLSVRLLPESLIPVDATALVLSARGAIDIQNAFAFLSAVKDRGDLVSVSWEQDSLCVETEFGEELSIFAESFSAAEAAPTTAELRTALELAEAHHLQVHHELGQVTRRLRVVQEMLAEQSRRIEVKASGHQAESTVGVLYLQQSEFIARVRRATEA